MSNTNLSRTTQNYHEQHKNRNLSRVVQTNQEQYKFITSNMNLSPIVGRGGSLVELTPIVRRVLGLTPALAASRDLGQALRSQLPEALWRETPTLRHVKLRLQQTPPSIATNI